MLFQKKKGKANDGQGARRAEDRAIEQEWNGVHYGTAVMGTRVPTAHSSYFPYF